MVELFADDTESDTIEIDAVLPLDTEIAKCDNFDALVDALVNRKPIEVKINIRHQRYWGNYVMYVRPDSYAQFTTGSDTMYRAMMVVSYGKKNSQLLLTTNYVGTENVYVNAFFEELY